MIKITDYIPEHCFFGHIDKGDFVKSAVKFNLENWKEKRAARSINGGGVGNRHARKHRVKMYTFSGEILQRGSSPIKKHEYNPDI